MYKYRWWINKVNEVRKEQNKNQGNDGISLDQVEGLPLNSYPMKNIRMR